MTGLIDEASAPDPRQPPRLGAIESAVTWRLRDRAGLAFAWFAGLGFCVICAALVIYLLVQGVRYLHPDLIWSNPKPGDNQSQTGGFLAPLIGTALVTTMAMVLATPIGIGIAVWLSEYARPGWLARVVESTVEMLAGAPSVVLALFGLLIFRGAWAGFLSQENGGVVVGESFLDAAPLLALLGLPLVVTTTREGLQAIPNHVREASYAVGKTKIATIRRVLLPAARPSVIAGTMLSTAHVIGDTAIIVLVLGDTSTSSPLHPGGALSIFSGTGSTLTSYVFDSAPTGTLNQPQKAFVAALVLLVMVLMLNLIVDTYGRKARDLKWN
jgi:phosphate transport system permease protein